MGLVIVVDGFGEYEEVRNPVRTSMVASVDVRVVEEEEEERVTVGDVGLVYRAERYFPVKDDV